MVKYSSLSTILLPISRQSSLDNIYINSYLNILRPLNLIIIVLCQAMIYFIIIQPSLSDYGLLSRMNGIVAWLFFIATSCIAAAGYVINDVFDHQMDEVNKPHKVFVGNDGISQKNGKLYYYFIVGLGFAISLYIAQKTHRLPLLVIYPIATVLLYYYSKKWKKNGLIGNVIVALFTAFVPSVLLLADVDVYLDNDLLLKEIALPIIAFASFSYLINLVRELCKDIEDIDGDRRAGSKSVPISIGVEQTKFFIYFHLIILLGVVCAWQYTLANGVLSWMYCIVALCLSITYVFFRFRSASEKTHYSILSKQCKLIMLLGLIYLFVLHYKP